MNTEQRQLNDLVDQVQTSVNQSGPLTQEVRDKITSANENLVMNADAIGGRRRIVLPEQGLPASLPQAGAFDFDALRTSKNEVNSTRNRIMELTQDLGEEDSIRQRMLEDNEIPGAEKSLADIQSTLGMLKADRDALDLEKQRVPIEVEREFAGRGATTGGIAPHERAKLQDIFLRESIVASQQLQKEAQANALMGNISTSLELVDRAVNAELAPKRAELQALGLQYEFALEEYGDLFSEAERKQLEKLKKQTQKSISNLDVVAQDKADIGKLALAVAQAGGTQYQVQQVQRADSLEMAIALATPFINTAGVLGGGSNTPTSQPSNQPPVDPNMIATPAGYLGRPDLAPYNPEPVTLGSVFSDMFGFIGGGSKEEDLDAELRALGL